MTTESPPDDEANEPGRELDRLSQRLKELTENPAARENDEMVETVTCTLCGEEHHGEVFASPPDGFYIRYWCPEKGRRNRTSFA